MTPSVSRTLGRIDDGIPVAPIPGIDPDLSDHDWTVVRDRIEEVLVASDTSTQRRYLAEVAALYPTLSDEGRARFLRRIEADFGVDAERVRAVAAELLDAPADTAIQVRLRRALRPRFADLLHLLTGLDGGVKLLVDLRADEQHLTRRQLPMVEYEFERHLETLFDVGVLELHQITWSSPARLLGRLIRYEAVHEMDGWDDLRDRLAADRRCFAFLHPAMPEEPLVFIEIALTRGTPERLDQVLDRSAPTMDATQADTAVFYSITSCQPGLAGIHLGNELIKAVVGELQKELRGLDRFVTLSPIPSLRSADALDLADDVRERLGSGDWLEDRSAEAELRAEVLPATARYLTSLDRRGRPIDPVARFHLSNGAFVDAVLWRANTEDYGLERSWGIMASYRYDPETIAAVAAVHAEGERVVASEEIERLAAS